jgi:alanine dehydrogenase
MNLNGTLLLTRRDVASLLSINNCIVAVEKAFRLYGEGKTSPPGILGVHARDGGFHIKAGVLDLDRPYFAAKINANFPQNAKRFKLPLIQGVIVLSDAENGYPLAVMDSIEITIQRTSAATAVAAKYLAKTDSEVITICGCGNQGRASLRALSKTFPLKGGFAFDINAQHSQKFARELSEETEIDIRSVQDLSAAVRRSDIVVTCTPSNRFFLKREWLRKGTFIAAVGADNEHKQELDPTILSTNKTVVDTIDQAATIGELHHSLEAGLMTRDEVYSELGEVVAGKRAGRSSEDEIIIFDSTGMALQDVIIAAEVYEKAAGESLGTLIDFNEGDHAANR